MHAVVAVGAGPSPEQKSGGEACACENVLVKMHSLASQTLRLPRGSGSRDYIDVQGK